MKKNKKNNNIILDNFSNNISVLLNFESLIEYKKSHNIALDDEEKFFDLYFIKPSSVLSTMLSITKNGINNEKR